MRHIDLLSLMTDQGADCNVYARTCNRIEVQRARSFANLLDKLIISTKALLRRLRHMQGNTFFTWRRSV